MPMLMLIHLPLPNPGVYFVRHWPGGKHFFQQWFKQKEAGHDQDGLNTLVRGRLHRGDTSLPDGIQVSGWGSVDGSSLCL
jgi:hypothetical protein